ncbi:MAG: DUF736 domain-containing protein [Candidatus Micrarchaeota archaeon]|nr:DUF736 domain-containing protein [Candidatus Micrarchaeota archaeon]
MPEKEEGQRPAFSGETEAEESGARAAGQRPDFRVVQAEYDSRLGKTVFKDVGAMWRGTSKNGSDYYTLKIGKLRLLVFPNERE